MKKTVRDVEIKGKRVLMRADLNVPLDDQGNITDTTRIDAIMDTLKYLLDNNAKVILFSHLGRPKGKKDPKYSLKPVYEELKKRFGENKVKFVGDCIGPEVEKAVDELKEGEILLLENIRFYEEEEKDDRGFAEQLAKLGDVYVNDAFGAAHRAHASVHALPIVMKEQGKPVVAGFLMEKEINYLSKLLKNPQKPFVAILGGAKISTKIGVLEALIERVDKLLIGGAMAYTFFKALGYNVGKSLVETDKISLAFDILQKAKEKGVEILLPEDVVVTDDIKDPKKVKVVEKTEIPDDMEGVDIGPKTVKIYKDKIKEAKTVFWNGPVGVFEVDQFAKGTIEIAKMVASLYGKAITVVGGGDSIAAINKAGVEDKISHISTGGGASLEFIEKEGKLPGIEVIEDA